jgi:hypothetical protein
LATFALYHRICFGTWHIGTITRKYMKIVEVGWEEDQFCVYKN